MEKQLESYSYVLYRRDGRSLTELVGIFTVIIAVDRFHMSFQLQNKSDTRFFTLLKRFFCVILCKYTAGSKKRSRTFNTK